MMVYVFCQPFFIHMPLEILKNSTTHTLLIAFFIFFIAGISFWPLVDVFVLAFSLAVVLIPLQHRFTARMKSNHAATLLTITVILAIIGGVTFTVNIVYANLDYMSELASTISTEINTTISDWQMNSPIPGAEAFINPETISTAIDSLFITCKDILLNFLATIPSLLINALIFFLALFLFLLNGEEIINQIRNLLPEKTVDTVNRITKVTVDTMYSVYIVNFQCAIVTFFCAIPFFIILGYGHILFYATLAAIMQLIPFLGPQILILFLLAYALLIGDITGFFILCFLGYPMISGWIDFYLRPKLMGERVAIHPVLMMIGIFGGMMLMGIIGIILGPLIVTLVVSAYDLVIQTIQDIKNENIHSE